MTILKESITIKLPTSAGDVICSKHIAKEIILNPHQGDLLLYKSEQSCVMIMTADQYLVMVMSAKPSMLLPDEGKIKIYTKKSFVKRMMYRHRKQLYGIKQAVPMRKWLHKLYNTRSILLLPREGDEIYRTLLLGGRYNGWELVLIYQGRVWFTNKNTYIDYIADRRRLYKRGYKLWSVLCWFDFARYVEVIGGNNR